MAQLMVPRAGKAIDEEATLATLLAAIRGTALDVGPTAVVRKAPVREVQAVTRDVGQAGGRLLRRPHEAPPNVGVQTDPKMEEVRGRSTAPKKHGGYKGVYRVTLRLLSIPSSTNVSALFLHFTVWSLKPNLYCGTRSNSRDSCVTPRVSGSHGTS